MADALVLLQAGFITGSQPFDRSISAVDINIKLAQPYSGGWGHCLGSTASGDLYTWGVNQPIQIQTDSHCAEQPVLVAHGIKSAAAGFDHCLVVRKTGQLCILRPSTAPPFPLEDVPLPLPVVHVAVGELHSLIALENGDLYAFGCNINGQLGVPDSALKETTKPLLVMGPNSTGCPHGVKAIAAGARHNAVITIEGRCMTWGWDMHGQCGHEDIHPSIPHPTVVEALGPLHCIGIAAGLGHTLCCTNQGDCYAWGLNADCQLGEASGLSSASPLLVDGSPEYGDEFIIKVAAGSRHSLALCRSGKVWGFGHNGFGQLPVEAHGKGMGGASNEGLGTVKTPHLIPLTLKKVPNNNADDEYNNNNGSGNDESFRNNESVLAVDIAAGWWHSLISVKTRKDGFAFYC